MYFTDRGIEELADRRGAEQVSLAWLADRLRAFVDENPHFEVPVERLATWLARDDDDLDDDLDDGLDDGLDDEVDDGVEIGAAG